MFSNDLLKLTKIYCFYMELSVTIYILISCDFIDNVKGNVMDSSIHKSQEFDDYRACASNFEIHKDKIIRTEESKKMGAKYLNGKDVSSKDECMKFCCETSSCNVFVLEEKVLNQLQGTCYLFECGTPDDFKCKFTRHHNYSSAVMIVNRPQMQLENEIQYTQHERELTNLRMNENESNKSNYCHHGTRDNMAVDEPNPVAKEMKESSKILEDMDNTSFKSKGSKCSRYQFECRTSGECIAIYNACDGIPQCTDHSDEDVELGCPTTVLLTTVRNVKDLENVITFDKQSYNNLNANPINAQNTPPFSENNRILNPAEQNVLFKQQQQVQIPHQYLQYENNKMGVNQWKLNVNGQQLHGGSPSKNYMSSVNDKYSTPIQSNLPASPMDVTRDQVRAGPEGKLNGGTNFGAPSPWLSERSEGINIFNHNFGPLHNFNHKQNEVNIPYNYNGDFNNAPVNIPYDGYHDSVNGNNYPQNPSPWHKQYDNPLTSKNLKASEMGNTGSQESNNLRPEYYYEEAMKMKHTPTPNNPFVGYGNQNDIKQSNKQAMDMQHISSTRNNLQNQNTTMSKKQSMKPVAATVKTVAQKQEIVTTHGTSIRPVAENEEHSNRELEIPSSAELSNVKEELLDSSGVEDGYTEQPSGAFVSLTIGICVTVIMVFVVGCRLKVVHKRFRRGGKHPFANDADFLVNGMYL